MKKAKLTASQMRVAIAKDVIKQIKAKRMKITTGNYIRHVWDQPEFMNQKNCTDKKFRCSVCAIGAGIVSGVRLFNEVEFHDGAVGIDYAKELICKWFTLRQAMLIEVALEHQGSRSFLNTYRMGAKLKKGELQRADDMNHRLVNRHKADMDCRVIAIYRNIIKNKGDFKP